MAKLEETLSRFFGGEECGFNSGLLIVVAIVFLLLATNIFDDDSIWIWIILIVLLLFNFDDGCC